MPGREPLPLPEPVQELIPEAAPVSQPIPEPVQEQVPEAAPVSQPVREPVQN